MRFVKKFISTCTAACTAACIAVSFCACSSPFSKSAAEEKNKEYKGVDVSEPVSLIMYLVGDKAPDFDMVYDKINEILKDRLNAKLDVNFLPWDEVNSQYEQLFYAGEQFDLIFTAAGWGYYEDVANMKGFYPLTDSFLAAYAPDIVKTLPDEAWDEARINGNIYMVPNYQHQFGIDIVGVRGDLMEKYGFSDLTSPDDLEKYLDAVAENESDITPLDTESGRVLTQFYLFPDKLQVTGAPNSFFVYDYQDPDDIDIEYTVESDKFVEYARKMKKFYDKGYWLSDALTPTYIRSENWINGRSAMMIWNLGSVTRYAREINKTHPEWKATFADLLPGQPRPYMPYTNNGMAVNASSSHPERAMMVINELMTDPVLNNMTAFGIEGKHWEAAEDKEYKALPDAKGYPANGSCNWGWFNEDVLRSEYVPDKDKVYEKEQETLKRWRDNAAAPHPLSAFTFSDENVKVEMAAVNDIVSRYFEPISTGIVDDPEAAVVELREKLNEAGINKIIDEMNRQKDNYIKEKSAS